MPPPAGTRPKADRPKGKKSTGARSIDKLVKGEQERHDMLTSVHEMRMVDQVAGWHVKSEKNIRPAMLRRAETVKEEKETANVEMKLVRQARLRQLYAVEAEAYRSELSTYGLAEERHRA